MSDDKISEIQNSMIRMEHVLENVSAKQDTVAADIRDVKNAIYKPDDGLYARLRDIEQWKGGLSKFIWTFALSIAALFADKLFNIL